VTQPPLANPTTTVVDTQALRQVEPVMNATGSDLEAVRRYCGQFAGAHPAASSGPSVGPKVGALMAAATIDRDGIADAMPARVQEAITALEQTFDQVVQTRQRYEQTEADNVLHVNDIFGALGAPPKQPKDLIGPAHVALPGMDRPVLPPWTIQPDF